MGNSSVLGGTTVSRSINTVGSGSRRVRMGFTFQVADVNKPLLAVKRVTESGNHVCLGPKPSDNYIANVEQGTRIPLRPNGRGSYMLDVDLGNGHGMTEITVDSGAEESVCPPSWGQHFGIRPSGTTYNFTCASGNPLRHYGARDVIVDAPF